MTVAHPPVWRFAVDRGRTFTDIVATTPDGRLMAEHGEAPIAELWIGTQAPPHIFARHIVLPEQLPATVVEIDERVAVGRISAGDPLQRLGERHLVAALRPAGAAAPLAAHP